MIKLGLKAKDKITGFKGIITARVQYITGCDQYCLVPKASGGEIKDGQYFDESRLDIVGKGIKVKEVQDEVDPGGPNMNVPKGTY